MLCPATPSRSVEQRATIAVALFCAGVLFAVMLAPAIAGRVYICDDLGAFHIPLRHFYAWCLSHGEPFDWWPNLFGGFYALGEGQAGMYHPWHLVLYRWLPLDVAWTFELLANYPVLFVGTFFFLRMQLRRVDAAVVGAALVTFSGFTLLHFMHVNAISIIAHIPWLLLAIDRCITAQTAKGMRLALLAVALLTGSQLLLGYPQYVWMSLLIELLYIVMLTVRHHATPRLVGMVAIAKALGLAIGAIQLWPTYEALSLSARAASGSEFAGYGSLHPVNLVQFVGPYLFVDRVIGQNTHELGLYCGSATLLLVVWLLASRPVLGHLKWLTAFAAVLVGVGLWLAVGQYSSLYPLLTHLPVVGSFRFPARYVLLVHFGLSLLAAVSIVMLNRRPFGDRQRGRLALVAVWSTVAVSALLAIVAPVLWPSDQLASPVYRMIGPAIFLVAATAITLAALGNRIALPALIAIAIVDQGAYGLSYAVLPHTKPIEELHAESSLPPIIGHGRIAADLVGANRDAPFTGNGVTRHGYHRIDGYAGLIPRSNLDYRQLDALRVAGVAWVHRRASEKVIGTLGSIHGDWYPVPDPLPRVRCVTKVLKSDPSAINLAGVPLETTAFVEDGAELELNDKDEQSSGTAGLIEDRPGRIAVRTMASSPQLLVTTERFHPGWHASIAGEPVAALRVNGDFLGCLVPAGSHDVTFHFAATSRRLGALVSAIALVATLAAFVFCPSSLFLAPGANREVGNRFRREHSPIGTEEKALT